MLVRLDDPSKLGAEWSFVPVIGDRPFPTRALTLAEAESLEYTPPGMDGIRRTMQTLEGIFIGHKPDLWNLPPEFTLALMAALHHIGQVTRSFAEQLRNNTGEGSER